MNSIYQRHPAGNQTLERLSLFPKIWIWLCILYPLVILTSIAATNILLVLILSGWLFFRAEIPWGNAKVFLILVGLYLGWTLFAVAVSPFGSHWSDWMEERSTFLAIIPGLILGANPAWVRRSFKYVAIFLAVLSAYALWQYYTGFNILSGETSLISYQGYYRAEGLQNNPLTFTGMIGLSLPISLAVIAGGIIWTGFLGLLGSAAVVASMTRTMILGFILGGGVLTIWGSRRLRIAGLIIIAAVVILPHTIFAPAGKRLETEDETRIMLWRSALNIIAAYPWTGTGENNWNEAFAIYGEPYDHYKTTCHAHNDLLTCASENGIIGGLIFIALWGYIVLRMFVSALRCQGAHRELRIGFLTAFIIILFAGIFQNYQTDAEDALLMWFIVGAGMQLVGQKPESETT